MSTARVNNLTRASGSGIPSLGGVAGNRLTPTAWVNFNGTGVVAIRDAHNVASITDVGQGQYLMNFATPMDNVNYCAVPQGTLDNLMSNGAYMTKLGSMSTTQCGMVFQQSNANTYYDALVLCCVVFGGKA